MCNLHNSKDHMQLLYIMPRGQDVANGNEAVCLHTVESGVCISRINKIWILMCISDINNERQRHK